MADTGGYGTGQMPLAGAILCCTSIPPEQRAELGAVAAQMGATIKLDLTSDVTHLIVGDISSAKYRYVAKSREDVKVLLPEWLEAMRVAWMEGDDVDVAALEKEYRLPTFYGLRICLTGFDNPDQRKYIQDAVVQNGAEYHGDLTKNVTHLIAATPTGKKYEHAVNWRLSLVSWEWFEQSLQRGMTLDETYYHPTMPIAERGIGAWDRRRSTSPTLGKRTREAEQGQLANPRHRKLRRSASSRMGSQSEALWADITTATSERPQLADDDWTELSLAKEGLQREKSPQPACSLGPNEQEGAQPEDPAFVSRRTLSLPPNHNDGIFKGRVVFAYGFDHEKTEILWKHLESNGAAVIRSSAELNARSVDDLRRGYLVVPHDVLCDLTSLPGASGAMAVATNWWVERCLHGKILVDPTENILCRPFNNLSISGFTDLTVSSTGFTGIELLHVTKVVALMGATYDEFLSPKTSVMVCNSRKPNAEKLRFATEKRIPAVHATWLWECLRSGELHPFDDFLLNASGSIPQKKEKRPLPFTEVPTAPLSEEESAKLRNKKTLGTKQQSKARNGTRRGALDLTLSAGPTPLSTESSTIPNATTHESTLTLDVPSVGGFDGPASLPLQDISPNSPRRPSTSSNASTSYLKSKSTSRSNSTSEASLKSLPAPAKNRKVTKEPTPDSVIPVPSEPTLPSKDYTGIMSDLLAARKAAAASAVAQEDPMKKRRRQLGRAHSTRSNPSTGEDVLSRASSHELVATDRVSEKPYVQYQPSQELGWDAPGAQEERQTALVKDVVSEGHSLRAGRRKRS